MIFILLSALILAINSAAILGQNGNMHSRGDSLIAQMNEQCEAAHILIVSTIDGSLYGLNRESGHQMWVINPPENSKSLVHTGQQSPNNIYIPDPIEGNLYFYQKGLQKLQKLKVSLKHIVEKFPAYMSSEGVVHTSKKTSSLLAIDPFSGNILQTYSDDTGDSSKSKTFTPPDNEQKKAIYIGKTRYSLTIHSPSEVTNIEYSEFSSSAVGDQFDKEFARNVEIIVAKNGGFRYADSKNTWIRQFPSTVVSAFQIGKGDELKNSYSLFKAFPPQKSVVKDTKSKISGVAQQAYVGRLDDGSFYLLPASHFIGEDLEMDDNGKIVDVNKNDVAPIHANQLDLWDADGFCSSNPGDPQCHQLFKTQIASATISYPDGKSTWDTIREWSILNATTILLNTLGIILIARYVYTQRTGKASTSTQIEQTRLIGVPEAIVTTPTSPIQSSSSLSSPTSSPSTRKRNRRKKNKAAFNATDSEADDISKTELLRSLEVSKEVLGYGSHGTVVYAGEFEGRRVAIKRLLLDFYDVAHNEVKLLQDSDHHPNVIRYFYKEQSERFMYIALELSPASLFDVIEKQNSMELDEFRKKLKPKTVLYQIMMGINHLHSLKIVHRDIKPQNILFAESRSVKNPHPRVLISDFGLCKKLADDQSSFNNTNAGGTLGWRAPECIAASVAEVADSSEESASMQMVGTSTNFRISRKIDIFSAGCVFYYVLSHGKHPFGDRFTREVNIMKGNYKLSEIDILGEEAVDAKDVIRRMIGKDSKKRPDGDGILAHPYFWTPQRRLAFLQDVSDRFEVEPRDPPSALLKQLERGAMKVIGNDWYRRIDRNLLDDLNKRRKYDGTSLRDLLRALRNKKHHYQDLPEKLQLALGDIPDGFLKYFTSRFPLLFLHIFGVVCNTSLRNEAMFEAYFKPPDSYI